MRGDRIQRATDSLLCAIGDPLAELRGLDVTDRDFARAQCIHIGCAVIAKQASAMPRIAEAAASLAGVRLSHIERLHVEAGEAWLASDPHRAIDRYADVLARVPSDILALRLAQSCCFFVGDHLRSRDFSDMVLQSLRPEERGYSHALALASFAHAEVGDANQAEWLGRAALARDPSCPLGVHAVAHAIAETGDSRAGATWMRAQRSQWSVPSRMRTHNAWHLAMFDFDNGRPDSAIGILDHSLMPAARRSPLDACDAAAILWRLTHSGIDVDARWRLLSDAFEDFGDAGFWPFIDLNAAATHRMAGPGERLRRLGAAIAAGASCGGYAGERARRLTQPALRALDRWLAGDQQAAARQLTFVHGGLREVGGSRAQIGVLFAGSQRAGFACAESR